MTFKNPSAAIWRKSTRSGANDNCVEVAGSQQRIIAVRDSKNPDGPMLSFTRAQWLSFTAKAKSNEFDLH